MIVRDEKGTELKNLYDCCVGPANRGYRTEVDCNFFVLSVDLWDERGENEQNLVMHPNTSAAAIASSAATSPAIPTGYQHHGGYPPVEHQYYPNEYQSYAPHGSNPNYPHGYPATSAPYPPAPSSMHHSYGQPEEFPGQPGHTTGLFTRNLIGSLTASAFRLQDDNKEWGIWFITQDLSVRTEGTFRLKFSFLNLGLYPEPFVVLLTLGRQPESGDTRRPGVQLNRGTSRILATVMSEPFQVFSAKKFPGMIESTPLSKAFAGQGIRIPVRHGNNNETGSNGNAARGHQASNTPPEADMEDDEDN